MQRILAYANIAVVNWSYQFYLQPEMSAGEHKTIELNRLLRSEITSKRKNVIWHVTRLRLYYWCIARLVIELISIPNNLISNRR